MILPDGAVMRRRKEETHRGKTGRRPKIQSAPTPNLVMHEGAKHRFEIRKAQLAVGSELYKQ